MERKSVHKLFVLATTCLFLMGMTASSVSAQWWSSSSSTSSSSTSSTSSTSSSSSSGSTVSDPGATGPNSVCSYTAPSNTGYLAGKVYYPCSLSATTGATTLTGGFTNTYSDMEWLAKHVASHGYIVLAMTPNNNLGTNPSWTTAHKSGIAQLKKENTRSSSAIKGKVNTAKLQVMGFSKGGGGTLLASNSLGSGIKTAQALAPYMDFTYSLSSTKAKTACYTGTSDTIASPSAVVTMYNSLPSSVTKVLGYFNSMSHTDWMTGSSSNTYGKRGMKYIVSFMKYYLDGNSSYYKYLYGDEHTKDVNNNWFYQYKYSNQ